MKSSLIHLNLLFFIIMGGVVEDGFAGSSSNPQGFGSYRSIQAIDFFGIRKTHCSRLFQQMTPRVTIENVISAPLTRDQIIRGQWDGSAPEANSAETFVRVVRLYQFSRPGGLTTEVRVPETLPSHVAYAGILAGKGKMGWSDNRNSRRLQEMLLLRDKGLAAHRAIVLGHVHLATTHMQRRRGYEVGPLRRAAKSYLQTAIDIAVKAANGKTIGTFRIIRAPYGTLTDLTRHKVGQDNELQSKENATQFSMQGPTVLRDYLSHEEALTYSGWLYERARIRHSGIGHPPFSFPNFSIKADGESLAQLQNWYKWYSKIENESIPIPRLMMEVLFRKEFLRRYPRGFLPRPAVLFDSDFTNWISRGAGRVEEWGNLWIDPKSNPDVFLEILTQLFFVQFDPYLHPNLNRDGTVVYTYGPEVSIRLFGLLGFAKLEDEPFNFYGKESWMLSAKLSEFYESYLKVRQGENSKLRDKLRREVIRTLADSPYYEDLIPE